MDTQQILFCSHVVKENLGVRDFCRLVKVSHTNPFWTLYCALGVARLKTDELNTFYLKIIKAWSSLRGVYKSDEEKLFFIAIYDSLFWATPNCVFNTDPWQQCSHTMLLHTNRLHCLPQRNEFVQLMQAWGAKMLADYHFSVYLPVWSYITICVTSKGLK